jgi:F0F1-type ATP synthase membrane subunit b/b'
VLPDLSVLWVIFFVLLLTVLLNSLLFKPLLLVMGRRAQAVDSARRLAQKAEAEAAAATSDYEAKTAAARGEIYREMDETRRRALSKRGELLAATRQEADAQIATATSALSSDVVDARRQIEAESSLLGTAIVERLLDRKVS